MYCVTTMLEINLSSASKILKGNFPLNHDCILKVHYHPDCLVHFEYFTCRAQDSGALSHYFKMLYSVITVEIISVESFTI